MTKKTESSGEQAKIRYGDNDLQEFKELIFKKLEKARHDLELLKEAFTGQNENDTADTSPTFKVLEEGYSVMSKEENSHLAARQQNLSNLLKQH